MSFFSLPPELRYQIYGYMAIPYTEPFSVYHGLYLSCHQIKDEMDAECGPILDLHLRSICSAVGVDLDLPVSLLEKQHPTVSTRFSH